MTAYEPTADGGKVHGDAWSTEHAAADLQTSERKRERPGRAWSSACALVAATRSTAPRARCRLG